MIFGIEIKHIIGFCPLQIPMQMRQRLVSTTPTQTSNYGETLFWFQNILVRPSAKAEFRPLLHSNGVFDR
jgi:hypothetical protein